ncbi:Cyclic AMP-responsive element-binding protein 1, partial [Tyrophagus putrescentiae]
AAIVSNAQILKVANASNGQKVAVLTTGPRANSSNSNGRSSSPQTNNGSSRHHTSKSVPTLAQAIAVPGGMSIVQLLPTNQASNMVQSVIQPNHQSVIQAPNTTSLPLQLNNKLILLSNKLNQGSVIQSTTGDPHGGGEHQQQQQQHHPIQVSGGFHFIAAPSAHHPTTATIMTGGPRTITSNPSLLSSPGNRQHLERLSDRFFSSSSSSSGSPQLSGGGGGNNGKDGGGGNNSDSGSAGSDAAAHQAAIYAADEEAKRRREGLARRPSYRKILNDLTDGGDKTSDDERDAPPTLTLPTGYLKVLPASIQIGGGDGGQGGGGGGGGGISTIMTSGSSGNGGGGGGSTIVQYASAHDGQFIVPADLQTYQLSRHPQNVVMTASSNSLTPQIIDEASKKRELRLLKNREAAKECRRKKKEYIKCLENRVAVLENQNKALIDELKTLKELYCKKSD